MCDIKKCYFICIMSQDVLFFLKGCTHLYICMKHMVCTYKREIFTERNGKNIYIKKPNYLHFLRTGHCEAEFSCDADKCIWLSYKCIYNKVHLTLMRLCRHSSITIIFSSSHLPSLLPFFPRSEFRSATALTHTHDETERDAL